VESTKALRGSFTARVDDKGRLKLPTLFKASVEEKYGNSLFVTSVDGESVLLYPMPVWEALEARLQKVPGADPVRADFLLRVNFYGQPTEFDGQGRVVIQPRLRESAAMVGDVSVVGRVDYLELWNFDRLKAKLELKPFTDEHARVLAQYGV
jgi:MraZ protein